MMNRKILHSCGLRRSTCFCKLDEQEEPVDPVKENYGDIMVREGSVSFQVPGTNEDDCNVALGPLDRGVFYTCRMAVPLIACDPDSCPPIMGSCFCEIDEPEIETYGSIMVWEGSVSFQVEGTR